MFLQTKRKTSTHSGLNAVKKKLIVTICRGVHLKLSPAQSLRVGVQSVIRSVSQYGGMIGWVLNHVNRKVPLTCLYIAHIRFVLWLVMIGH